MKIVESARVLSVGDGRAEVLMAGGDDPANCTACAMASHCGSKGRRFTVDAHAGVKPGDEVKVEIDAPSPAWAAFLLFMLPLGAAVLAGGLTYGLSGSEVLGILGGAAGASAVYLVIYLAHAGSKGGAAIVDRSESPKA